MLVDLHRASARARTNPYSIRWIGTEAPPNTIRDHSFSVQSQKSRFPHSYFEF